MHEYSIVAALMEQVEAQVAQHGGARVERVQLGLGQISGVDPQLLRLAFEAFRERTVCHDASLDIRELPAVWRCRECDRQLAPGARLSCPDCGRPAQLTQGDEILLERIEMEVSHV